MRRTHRIGSVPAGGTTEIAVGLVSNLPAEDGYLGVELKVGEVALLIDPTVAQALAEVLRVAARAARR